MEYLLEATQRYTKLLDHLGILPKELEPECATNLEHLYWMLKEIRKLEMSETKCNRWLGYVQGCLASKGLISVNEERDMTRLIFNGK